MLEDFLGNEALKNDLAAALRAGRLPGAVLLCGEKGLGKGFLARCLAADHLYPGGGPGAQAVMRRQSPECLEVMGEGASGQIPVRRIREVRSEIMGTALSAAGRAVILYEAQNLNGASANALLKILEEPPEGAVFILTAPGAAAVLSTIRSRCAAYSVTCPPREEGVAFLREKGAGDDAAFYYDAYGGKVGLGLACIQQPGRREILEDAKKLARFTAQRSAYGLCALFSGYEKDKGAAQTLLSDGAQLLAAASGALPNETLPLSAASGAVRFLEDASLSLRRGGNVKLILTALAIRLSRGG
ncbi:MAG: hypothetical protein Q4G07_02225 [Oscillospiraceae bacterium]|nr:hypothetical protein [Oscillospiraceae bacterium]